jgi:hypothetical protein
LQLCTHVCVVLIINSATTRELRTSSLALAIAASCCATVRAHVHVLIMNTVHLDKLAAFMATHPGGPAMTMCRGGRDILAAWTQPRLPRPSAGLDHDHSPFTPTRARSLCACLRVSANTVQKSREKINVCVVHKLEQCVIHWSHTLQGCCELAMSSTRVRGPNQSEVQTHSHARVRAACKLAKLP